VKWAEPAPEDSMMGFGDDKAGNLLIGKDDCLLDYCAM
jgi:hypothetical protein